MRLWLSTLTAFLFTLFVAEMCTGQMMDNCSHEEMQVTHCTCAHHLSRVSGGEVHASSPGQDCCLSCECEGLPSAKDIALAPTVLPLEYFGTIGNGFIFLFTPGKISQSHHTGWLSPHLRSTPIYKMHCSFLI